MKAIFESGDRILVSAIIDKVAGVPTNWPVKILLDRGDSETIDNGGNVHFSAIHSTVAWDAPPLQQLIDLWTGIVKLHNDDLSKPTTESSLHDFRRADRLKAKAQMVLAALTHYQIELER